MVSVGALIEQGAIALARGTLRSQEVDFELAKPWTASELRRLNDRQLSYDLDPDESDDPARPATEEFEGLTEPGDIVLSTTERIRAAVDHEGGRPLAVSLYRLRVDPDHLDATYVAHALTGEWNRRHQVGVAVNRADPRDLEIPLLPGPEQRKVADVLYQAEQYQAWARSVVHVLDAYQEKYLEAVRQGVTVQRPDPS
jgi:hypothetical protein